MPQPNEIALSEEYSRAVELNYQQKTSKLYPLVRTAEQEAQDKYFNYIGSINFQPISTRLGNTILQNVDHNRRRCVVSRDAAGVPIDDEDDLYSVTDLAGPYMQGLFAGAGRLVDEKIWAGIHGVAYAGKHGATSVNSYDSGECRLINGDGVLVTAGSNFGGTTETALTTAKIELIKETLVNAKAPLTGLYMLINEYNKNQLMRDTNLTTDEKVVLRNIKDGDVPMIHGLGIIIMPDDFFTVNATDTGCIECAVWQRDAIVFSKGTGRKMPRVKAGERPDMNYARQLWADMYTGATRLMGPGVVRVLLKKSA
jgi:hypothetical protein